MSETNTTANPNITQTLELEKQASIVLGENIDGLEDALVAIKLAVEELESSRY